MSTIARTLDEALAPITEGCMLAVPRESSGAAMAATRALVRRRQAAAPDHTAHVELAGGPSDRRRLR